MNNDHPKTTQIQDRFQRYEFGKRISLLIQNYNESQSLVLGLYGKWGEGKTSLMNFIKAELPKDTVIINFNPWLFSDQGHLIESFFNSIAYGFNQSLDNKKEKIGKLLSDYGNAIGTVTKFAGISLDGISLFGDKLKVVSIEKLKERVDKIIIESNKSIVVFIDDIDRLDTEEIQYIFKLIKLVGDFPRTSYILAFDDEMVAKALAPKYGGQDKSNGYLFLEKIIQVPLKIPKATRKSLRQYTIDLINQVFNDYKIKLDEKEMGAFMNGFEDCFVPHIENPRLGIRYSNTLAFSIPLLIGEVNTADLMLLEGIKIFFPETYDFLRLNASLFLTDTSKGQSSILKNELNKDEIRKRIDEFLTIYSVNKRKLLLDLIQSLFPQVFYVYKNYMISDNAWRVWYLGKRLASGMYFDRYFTYTVQNGDISDNQFNQLLASLENSTVEDSYKYFEELFETIQPSDIVFKLRLWEDKLSLNQSKTLALILVNENLKFPIEEGEFSSYTTYAEAGKIIAQLMANIPTSERLEFVILILTTCKNMSFAFEVANRLFHKNEKADEKILSEDEIILIEKNLIGKFKLKLNLNDLFEILSDNDLWRLLLWWSRLDKADLDKLVDDELTKGIIYALNFIKTFTPTITSYGNKGPQKYKAGFNEKNYDSMALVLDTNKIYNLLSKSDFTRTKTDLTENTDRDPLSDNELVNIFMSIHEKKQNIS